MSERRSSPWPWILLALGILFAVVGFMIVGAISSVGELVIPAEGMQRIVLDDEPGEDGVLVEVGVDGVIMDAGGTANPVTRVRKALAAAAREPNLKGILLHVLLCHDRDHLADACFHQSDKLAQGI